MAEIMAKHIAITGSMSYEILEHQVPHAAEDALLLRIDAASICGTDQHSCKNAAEGTRGVIGHEFTGTIVELGSRANETIHCYGGEMKVGDRIVVYPHISCQSCDVCMTYGNGICSCDDDYLYGRVSQRPIDEIKNSDPDKWPYFKGGFGEYVYISPNTFVWKLPEDMPSDIASLLDPMAVAVRAVEQTMTSIGGLGEGVSTNSTCLIIGAGPIGVMTAMYLKAMGVEKLIVSDFLDEKLKMAKEISGADIVLNMSGLSVDEQVKKVMDATDGLGAHIVISCANSPMAAVGGLQMVRKLGHYVEVGCISTRFGGKELTVPFHDLLFSRNIQISSVVATTPSSFDRAFRFLKRWKQLPFDKLITHRFYDLNDLIPHIEMMTQPDYLKATMIFNHEEKEA